MATSSPYSGNDYQAMQYRPYELPVNDIMKAFVAKNQFWEQGAARIKNVYETALNLDLTLEQNKAYKNEFMQKAQEEIKKLSSMELSDPDIQKKGISVFTPLLKDKMIAIDDQLTKHRKSILQDAESYKTKKLSKDGVEGEGYSQENLAYAMDGFEQFNSSTPRDEQTLTNLYKKLSTKSYTPSYDITKEYKSILDKCKGSSQEGQNPMPGTLYFDTFSKSGATSDETANCFMMGFSDKARQQLAIKGWSAYKNNPDSLYEDYREHHLGNSQKVLSGIRGNIAALENSKKPEDQKQLALYKEALALAEEKYTNAEKEFNEIVGPNSSEYIMKNFDTIAGGLYMKKMYKQLGDAFRDDEIVKKFTPNTAAIAQMQVDNQRYLKNLDYQMDLNKMQIQFDYDKQLARMKGEIPLDDVGMFRPSIPAGSKEEQQIKEDNANKFIEDNVSLRNDLTNKYNTIRDYIKSKNSRINLKDMTDDFILNYVDKYDKSLRNDETFNTMLKEYKDANKNWWNHNNIMKNADDKAARELGPEYNDFLKKQVTLSDGTVITGNDVSKLKSSSLYLGPNAPQIYTINGKTYQGSATGFGNSDFAKINSLISENKSIYDKIKNKRNEILGMSLFDAGSYMKPRVEMEKMPLLDNNIKEGLGITGQEADGKKSYSLVAHDRTGSGMYIAVNEKGTPLETRKELEPYLVSIKNKYADAKIDNIGGKQYIYIPNMIAPKEDILEEDGVREATALNYFKSVHASDLSKSGKLYTTSEQDGVQPYYPITSKRGNDYRVVAIYKNGKTFLKPEKFTDNKEWDTTSYPLYENSEDLVRDIYNDLIRPNAR